MAKILIAEDEPDIRDLMTMILEYGGHDVTSANDGLQALTLARANPFDLFLLDVRMPGVDGYEVCRILRETDSTQHIPVLFVSAKGQEAEIEAGLEAGADKYILKPFAPDELIEMVGNALAK
jgi:DNA-binding response OmpR family regulator